MEIQTLSTVRPATLADIKYIVSLSKGESNAIGFIPKAAYETAITGIKKGKCWSNKSNTKLWVVEENGDLLGFLLMSFGKVARINQICIQPDARQVERGKLMLQEGTQWARNEHGLYEMTACCANDLESNKFWKALDFVQVGTRNGKAWNNTWNETSDRLINIYNKDEQPTIFTEGLFNGNTTTASR